MNNTAPLTISHLQRMKAQGEKIAMLTCYDATFAGAMDQAGVDIILIGDSMGMVVQGRSSTVGVSLDEIAYHTACVARGVERAFVLADMPFGSYHDEATAMESAVDLLSAGGVMVKLEGAGPMIPIVEYLTNRGVPVCAHLGLTPQSVNQLGGFKVQAREEEEARQLLENAHPSEADLGFLPSLRSAGSITLCGTSITDQGPQAGLQVRTTVRQGEATTGELLGLRCIALGHAYLGQAIQHLRFAWRYALGTLEARRCAIQVATGLLLLRGGQQRQHRAIQLLVSGQAASARGRRNTAWRRRHVVGALVDRCRLDRRGINRPRRTWARRPRFRADPRSSGP